MCLELALGIGQGRRTELLSWLLWLGLRRTLFVVTYSDGEVTALGWQALPGSAWWRGGFVMKGVWI